ncbi:MAG: hypothetical protein IKH31_01325 [Clostridia bacterium]|jgi:hypothetical protein|nr:hypothetical protein [Clostridia bacterium]MBQ4446868.1 hypothetical protein [Clostridia bacterium]MBR3486201.1 hypothetical protein [Clostridia bacterium]
MGLKKCPRCELNYIKDDEKLCNVCRRSAKHEEPEEEESICIECGEHPALKGKELCAECYKESLRQEHLQNQRKTLANMDFDDVDGVSVDLPDEEIPTGNLPDELADEFDDEPAVKPEEPEEGEIEFSKGLSLEALSEEEQDEPDENDEYDEGFTPARRPRRD